MSSRSSSKSKSTSLVAVSSELDESDLLNDLYYSIQFNNNIKKAISILRKYPHLADYEYKDTVEKYIDFKKTTPLMLCSYYGNYDVLKELLNGKYKINLEYKNEHNQSPLTMVADGFDGSERKFKIVKLLIKRGADINHMDVEGSTLFSGVCSSFYDGPISYLLKFPKLDINKKKKGEDSPFHILILKFCEIGYHEEYIKIIKKMVNDSRLDINIKGYNGETILHILSSVDRQYDHNYSREAMKKLVTLLIYNGANPDIVNDEGISPLNNDIIKECYEIYMRSKLNQAENRLVLAKIAKELNEGETIIDEDVLIKISKEIPFLSEKELNIIDRKILAEKIRSSYKSPDLDDMIEFYRKQLKNPKLLPKHRKIIRRKKKKRKMKLKMSLGSSDLSTSRKSRSSIYSRSSRKSRSLNSEEELNMAKKMSIAEFDSGKKKKNNKKKKTIKK